MSRANAVGEDFNRPTSSRTRLILSLVFVMLATALLMTIFQAAKDVFNPDVTLLESQLYTIVFISIAAPVIAFFVLIRFDNLYRKAHKELQERKRAEEALRSSERKFRNIVEQVNDWVWETDVQGRYNYASPRVRELLGYGPDEMIGRSPFDFMTPGEAERVRSVFDPVFEARQPISLLENTLVRKDGGRVIVETGGTPIFDEEGTFVGYRGIDRDVTERKLAGEELRKLTRVVEESPAIVVITDVNGDIEYVNPRFTRVTGYTLDEVRGKTPRIFKSGHTSREEYEQLWNAILAGKEWRGEFRNKKKNGDLYWESAIISPFVDTGGQITGFMALKEDITERKRAEEALRKSEKFLNNVLDSIQDGISVLDKDLNIIRVNHVIEQWHPYMMPIVGKKCYHAYHGRSSTCDLCPSLMAIGTKTAQSGIIPLHDAGNNVKGWLEIFSFPLLDDDGNVTGVIEHLRDITDRKAAEEALQDARARAELYLDLMGHDINNMHQIALGYLELASDLPPGAEQSQFLDRSIEVLQRSTQLIKNVSKLQKLSDGVSESHDIDACQVLADVQRESGTVPGKTVTLNLNGREHCYVRANKLIYDVFANLVSNAIKHTGEHAMINIDLDVIKDRGRHYCRVTIEDNGPGIADDFKGKVFNRMLKGDSRANGMGLGLYLVKSLVDSYGGHVRIEDRVPGDHSKGAKFVVLLPAVEKQ